MMATYHYVLFLVASCSYAEISNRAQSNIKCEGVRHLCTRDIGRLLFISIGDAWYMPWF